MRRSTLLDSFLKDMVAHADEPWFQQNASAFLEVCAMHGEVALQHHEQLVEKFIVRPAAHAGLQDQADLSASG